MHVMSFCELLKSEAEFEMQAVWMNNHTACSRLNFYQFR